MNEAMIALIERIYAAAGQAPKWNRVLKDLSELVGASSGCIVSVNHQSERGRVGCFHEIDPDWIDAYNQWYYAYDPTLSVLANQPGRILIDHVTGPHPNQLQGSTRTFYHEVMVPQSFRHTLQLGFPVPEGQGASLILQRSARQGSFSEKGVAALDCLMPHLSRALSLHTQLDHLDILKQGLVATMDQTDRGLVLLDAQGGVIHINHRAKTLLTQSKALHLTPEGLSARRCHEHQALQACIRQALAPGLERQRASLRLFARDGSPSLHIQVTPLRAKHDHLMGHPSQGVKAAVWIDRYEQKSVCAETLSNLYNLPSAESDVLARLVEGYSQTEIARLRSVNHETVRSQIKSLMAKLGASRQADLVRIVLSDPGVIAATN